MNDVPVEASGDHVHAHARRTGHRWFDVTMAIAAIFISIVSLYVAVEHGHTERDLVAANSWPFPTSFATDSFGEREAAAFGIVNAGTGPAKIYSVEVSYAGRPVGSARELLRRCCGAPADDAAWKRAFPEGSVVTSSIDNSVLRPGDRVPLLIVRRDTTDVAIENRFATAVRSISMSACYCSVLDECWTTAMRNLDVTRVKSCPAPVHPYHPMEW